MRHRWKKADGHDFCTRCGMRRRRVVRKAPGRNRARHSYPVTEYSRDNGETWRWVLTRHPVPPCPGVYL